jgi:hypothetical protein
MADKLCLFSFEGEWLRAKRDIIGKGISSANNFVKQAIGRLGPPG